MKDFLQKLKKFDEAALNYKKVLKLKPNYIDIFNNLGSILNKTGKIDEAESIYNEGLNLNPKFEPLLINRGQMFFDKNNFELALKDYLKTDSYVVCVNSGTAALHLSLQAANIGIGDEVLVPSITYVATYQAISATGAVPVSCDVHPKNLFLDLNDAEKRISKRP